LNLNGNGEINGSPNSSGTFNFSVTLTDSCTGASTNQTFSMTINAASVSLQITTSTNGVISGVPNTISSNYQFIAGVTDSASNNTYRQFSLDITGNTTPPTLSLVRQPGNGTIEFTFTSVNGMNYSVQSSPNLTSWTTILDFTGGGGTETLSAPTTQGKMFYRLQTGN
jgi:hypothetical protein